MSDQKTEPTEAEILAIIDARVVLNDLIDKMSAIRDEAHIADALRKIAEKDNFLEKLETSYNVLEKHKQLLPNEVNLRVIIDLLKADPENNDDSWPNTKTPETARRHAKHIADHAGVLLYNTRVDFSKPFMNGPRPTPMGPDLIKDIEAAILCAEAGGLVVEDKQKLTQLITDASEYYIECAVAFALHAPKQSEMPEEVLENAKECIELLHKYEKPYKNETYALLQLRKRLGTRGASSYVEKTGEVFSVPLGRDRDETKPRHPEDNINFLASKAGAEDFLDFVKKAAKHTMEERKEHFACAILACAKNPDTGEYSEGVSMVYVMPESFDGAEDKDAFAAKLKELSKKLDAYALAFISESWCLGGKDISEEEQKAWSGNFDKHPNRKEALIINVEHATFENGGTVLMTEILRDGEKVTLGEFQQHSYPPKEALKKRKPRFMNLLPERPQRGEN